MASAYYMGVYCPSCGRKLQEEYRGVERLGVCARGHTWRVTASLEGYRLEQVATEAKDQGASYRARAW